MRADLVLSRSPQLGSWCWYGELVQRVGGGSGVPLPVAAPAGLAACPDGGAALDPPPPISSGSRPAMGAIKGGV